MAGEKTSDGGISIRVFVLAAFCLCSNPASVVALAEHDLMWMRTYDSAAHSDDGAEDVAVDGAGNIYVAGWTYRPDLDADFNALLIKYRPDGTIDSSFGTGGMVMYNSFPYGEDAAYGVAVGADGSIYVAGYTDTISTNLDAWLRKFNSDGAEIWTRTYNSEANSRDYYNDVAVDASGNVVAVGRQRRADLGEGYNWLVSKYDFVGNLLWTRSYNGWVDGNDRANGVTTAPNGDVVVVGYETTFSAGGFNRDIMVRRYSPAGVLLWAKSYGSEIAAHFGDDEGNGVSVDAGGNVYVVGQVESLPSSAKRDTWLRKYSSDGSFVYWTKQARKGNIENDRAHDCVLGLSGGLYMTGRRRCSDGGCNQGYNLIAELFDLSNGWRIHATAYDAGNFPNAVDEEGNGIAVDGNGNYIVAGWQETQTDTRRVMSAATLGGQIYVLRGAAPGGGNASLEAYDPANDKWIPKAGMQVMRMRVGLGVANGKLYAVGGFGPGGVPASVEVYDPVTNAWASKAPMPTARAGVAVGVAGGKIYAFGGTRVGGILSTVDQYDPITNVWTARAPMPTPRYEATAVEYGGKIYVMGGGDGSSTVYNTLEIYDPVANAWTVAAAMPTTRVELTAEVVAGKIYAIGGESSGDYLAVVEEYDPVGDTWVTMKNMPTARAGLVSGIASGKVYAIGGANGVGNVPVVEEFDPTVGSWFTKTSLILGRFGLGVAEVGGTIYAVGGDGWLVGNTRVLEMYDSAADRWILRADMPSPRSSLAVAAAGGRIYATGGWSGTMYLAANEAYDPAANTWAIRAEMPTAKYLHGSASVGTKVYVVGGMSGTVYLAEVEEYDTVGDFWVTKAPMPTARNYLTIAAIGGKIYAFGGFDGAAVLATVEEYDPAGNTWLARADMPTARNAPAVVVMNGKLWVLAGSDGGGDGDMLEIYDPVADTWTSGPRVPTPRFLLGAAALDGKVYAIGGYGNTDPFLATVEQFDPASGSWALMTDMRIENGSDWVVRKYSGPVVSPLGLEYLKVYPNPFRPASAVGGSLKFANLPLGSTVQIYTVRGYRVRKLQGGWKTIVWDGRNDKGQPAATGIYMYTVSVDGGKPVKGKFALIR